VSESPWTPEQEQLLEDVVVGNLPATHPKVQAACADARFRDELRALVALSEQLGDAAAAENRDLRDATDAAEPFDGADDLVRRTVTDLARSESAGPRGVVGRAPGRTARWWSLSVAAFLLVGVAAWWWSERDEVRRGQGLSSWAIECLAPVADVDDLGSFRWRFDSLPAGGYFRVEVFDLDRPAAPPITSPRLPSAAWEATAELPPRIRWEVRAYDATGGTVLAKGRAEAARR